MIIGINASAVFKQLRTGVEEYTYQLIKHIAMLEEAQKHRFILYTPRIQGIDLQQNLPFNFELNKLAWPLPGWTQFRLASHLLFHKPQILFIPVHVLPYFSPKNSIVVIHGLEYEYYPEMYPLQHLKYLRWATKNALKRANKIIAVSENTKKDLINLYQANPNKIFVVHHGFKSINLSQQRNRQTEPYILYLGRLDLKKNIHGLIKAFELLKEKYQVPHKLVLAGPPGFGYQQIKFAIDNSKARKEIIEKGYVSENEKQSLLSQAEVFVLISFYEGFGMPILEAQAAGCPVLAANTSAIPEVVGQGGLLVNPESIEQIAKNMYKIINNQMFKQKLIKQGRDNLTRFSWERCAQQSLSILLAD